MSEDTVTRRAIPRAFPTIPLDHVAPPWTGRLVYWIDRKNVAHGPLVIIDEGVQFVDPIDPEHVITETHAVTEETWWAHKYTGAPLVGVLPVAAHHALTLAL